MEVVRISVEDAKKLLDQQEGHFLDFKAREIAPAKLTKSLSAFVNSDGGDLYIGVAEDKLKGEFNWVGFGRIEDANGHLETFEMVSPFGDDLDGEFLEVFGDPRFSGYVLHVNARKSRFVRKSSDQKVYKRLGAFNKPVVTEEAITALRRHKGLESFEDETLAIPIESVTNSLAIIEYLLQVVPTAEPDIYLKGQYLIHGTKPTVASVLLFADLPQAVLPKRCGIKIYRYGSEDVSRDRLMGDPTTIEGNLYNQVYSAVERTVAVISEAAFLDEDGLRTVRYPTETLHEIITNAILHRDYSITDDVHIRIFENRVEVESPGRLPGHIRPDNILSERLSRNPYLVRHLNRFPNPPNKDVGEGLDTAFEFMKKLNLKNPTVEERENSVRVTIRHESLASPAQQVVEYLESNEQIRNEEARKLTGVNSESKMKKTFTQLIQAGEIEHVPGSKGRGYAYRRRR